MNIYISALKKMLYLYIQILIIELKTSIKNKVSTEFISTFIASIQHLLYHVEILRLTIGFVCCPYCSLC